LRTAIEELQRECVIEGCHVSRHLQLDHNVPIEEGGPTALWNLNRLCAWHHQEKTRLNLRLEGEGTRKRLVPRPSPPPPDERAPPPARELALV
jgi:5-methylcytosine-specific restriction endonuclease McrA